MDPPSNSINEILYRKAEDALLHDENFQDILRPLQGVELPAEPITIDIDDTALTVENEISIIAAVIYCFKRFKIWGIFS
ncbi:unnamed protein product [Adineta ricciae]|uniref:Uncharacterized protein n=1 Tax=Adineta ricciae TaxID=249248 RepID=A0A816ECT6_ADIRI|nr:unnamed protein product [Adineta ricciae]